MEVVDLCRSGDTHASHRSTSDYVSDNTDFEELFLGNDVVFVSNDLRRLSGKGQYKNSHWTSDTIEKRTYRYLSTMVWPIHKVLNAPPDATAATISPDHDLLGFLCVDSLATNIFQRDVDYGLGAAYADMFYTALKVRKEHRPRSVPEGEQV
jgi:hypothetical protein